jgi:hypothetical protein
VCCPLSEVQAPRDYPLFSSKMATAYILLEMETGCINESQDSLYILEIESVNIDPEYGDFHECRDNIILKVWIF